MRNKKFFILPLVAVACTSCRLNNRSNDRQAAFVAQAICSRAESFYNSNGLDVGQFFPSSFSLNLYCSTQNDYSYTASSKNITVSMENSRIEVYTYTSSSGNNGYFYQSHTETHVFSGGADSITINDASYGGTSSSYTWYNDSDSDYQHLCDYLYDQLTYSYESTPLYFSTFFAVIDDLMFYRYEESGSLVGSSSLSTSFDSDYICSDNYSLNAMYVDNLDSSDYTGTLSVNFENGLLTNYIKTVSNTAYVYNTYNDLVASPQTVYQSIILSINN